MAGSAEITRSLLLQLPLNPSAPLEATGNIPLAGASLAAAASLSPDSVAGQDILDHPGDMAMVEYVLDRHPSLVAFTLYMWNVERSAWLARELKTERPDIVTVCGGPEVSADNTWLADTGCFDLLVSGEGEEVARQVLDPVSAITISRETGGFLQTGRMDFIPGSHPNPWLTGHLDPSSGPVHIETVRGCSGGCEYCSYRRSSPVPRIMRARDAVNLLRTLAEMGAREVVFLDPTFNSRPDLAELLDGMSGLGMEFFGEMRGDLISPEIALMIADAGFRSVEIGLQSCNRNSLEKSGRAGDPEKVLQGAMNLRNAGVTPVMDIMLGLPGDTPEDAVRTAVMIRDRNLHQHLQVFHISVLPGTALRERCRGMHMDRPPYYRFSDPEMGGFARAREKIADIAGYDLDMADRPVLFEGWPGTRNLDLDGGDSNAATPSFRQAVLRVTSDDIWPRRHRLLEEVERSCRADPWCCLDIVLVPGIEFPLDIIDMIRETGTTPDYSNRTARVLVREGRLRVAVIIRDIRRFHPDWIESAALLCTVAVDVNAPSELPVPLWKAGVCARLPGNGWDMAGLAAEVPSMHQVFFSERVMEEEWSRAMDI